jgi:drug/metabolite transporter (DMT)-like permease
MTTTRHLTFGALWMVLGCLGMSGMTVLAKLLRSELFPSSVVMVQALTCLVIITPTVVKGGFTTHHPWRQFFRSIGGFGSLLLYVTSLKYIPLVDAALLNQTAPLWSPFIIWIWCRCAPPLRPWIGVILGFVGVLFVLHPGQFPWNSYFAIALLSGVAMGLAFVAMKSLSGVDRPQLTLFYTFVTGTVCTMPVAIIHHHTYTPHFILIAIAAGICLLIGQWGFIRAFAYAPTHSVVPLYFLVVPFTATFDWLIWNQVPDWLSYVGAIFIILGGSWTLYTGRRELPEKF